MLVGSIDELLSHILLGRLVKQERFFFHLDLLHLVKHTALMSPVDGFPNRVLLRWRDYDCHYRSLGNWSIDWFSMGMARRRRLFSSFLDTACHGTTDA